MRPEANHRGSTLAGTAVVFALCVFGCGDDDDFSQSDFIELDRSICAPESAGPFSTVIDNEFFPAPVGTTLVLEGVDDEGFTLRIEISVTGETKNVAGVITLVVEEAEFEDGELIELTRNFIVQAPDGTVCYYGEEVDQFENGELVGHAGEWRAGEGRNRPGIVMPGNPRAGTFFLQELAPGIAVDRSAIISVGSASISVPFADFDRVLFARDWNPLAGETFETGEDKFYARGVGLVADDFAELVEVIEPTGL